MTKLEAQLTTEDKLLLDQVIALDKQLKWMMDNIHSLKVELVRSC